jgi:hypothetical protein
MAWPVMHAAKRRLQRELQKFVLVAPKFGPREQRQHDTLRNPHMVRNRSFPLALIPLSLLSPALACPRLLSLA